MADLRAIAKAAPVLNQRAARRQQEALDYQFLGSLAEAPAQPQGAMAVAQQVAPTAAAQAAGVQQEAAQKTQNTLLGAGRAALAQEGAGGRLDLAKQESALGTALSARQRAFETSELEKNIAARKEVTDRENAQQRELSRVGNELDLKASFLTNKQREDLASLGGDLDYELFQSRLIFDKSEGRRRFSNSRQLEDLQLANAKSDIDFKNKARELKQAADFQIAVDNIIAKKVEARIDQRMKEAIQRGDQATRAELAEMRAAHDRRVQRAQAQSNRMTSYLKIGAAAVATYFTGGSAAPLLAGAVAESEGNL